MPQTLQEWAALSMVALTIGFIAGRWITQYRLKATANQPNSSDCASCPQSKPVPQSFKNIPIDVENKK